MKLTYWHACYLNEDHGHYDIRTKTKKEALMIKAANPEDHYGEVTKQVIEYADGFDLMSMCYGNGHWEPSDCKGF